MRILSVDPGYDKLGFAILEERERKPFLVHSECFRTKREMCFEERLFFLGKRCAFLIEKYSPEEFAMETLFFSNNAKTAMHVAEVRGALLYLAMEKRLLVFEYAPQTIKSAVSSYGRGEKGQISRMVERLIDVPHKITEDDEYDAIAVGLTHLASRKGYDTNRGVKKF
ncbi:MAG: crossover junction endodeoxyribonuclease RuvC [Patescibacteria group bacterium]